ncbi:alpha/beta hydrolase [Nocardia sp. NPDC005978]|uniref:alpha/beta hydrolase n=1 Tax=Nocardia sp. NPDC005978 TaxID=3156725 RepID=UPI0033A8D64B
MAGGIIMTLIDSELSALDGDSAPIPILAEVGGIPVSGLLAEARDPRAVLVALHGGSTSSVYYDCPGHPELSLLRLGQRLGYTVQALDRPGYGASTPFAAELGTAAQRVDLMFGAIAAHLGSRPRGAGIFLVGHSAGCELIMRMAADERGADLLGVELAGTGRLHPPFAEQTLRGPDSDGGTRAPTLGDLLWQPERLYPPDVRFGGTIAASGARLESSTVQKWAEHDFPRLAGRVPIPVRFTIGDHERVWRNDSQELTAVAALFGAAPRVVLSHRPNTGHNLSVGYTAAAYHLSLLAFAEECVAARADGDFSAPTTQLDGFAHASPSTEGTR